MTRGYLVEEIQREGDQTIMTDVDTGMGNPNQETILSHPDAAILSNLAFSATLFIIFILIYSMVRQGLLHLYAPNITPRTR